MKIDWSQMGGFWVMVTERMPPSAGEYYICTNRLREYPTRYDGEKWTLKHEDEWVVYWYDTLTDLETGLPKKHQSLFLRSESA